jgi:hypothetical protein
MGYSEYQKLLTRAKNKMSHYLNSIGLYYNKEIQKFVGFNDYEIVLIEFRESFREEISVVFSRYTSCLDQSYQFSLPKKNRAYPGYGIKSSHWVYYPEGTDKKDKKHLNLQLEMMTDEMLEEIKLQLEPRILTDWPIELYIKEKYIQVTDELATKKHPLGYTFYDEWYDANEKRISTMPWWSNLCNELEVYETKKREALLPYKDFYDEMMQRYERNKIEHQKEAKNYLSKFKQSKFIKPTYKYYTIKEVMSMDLGKYVEQKLQEHGFVRQESFGCHRHNKEAFYSEDFNIEIYLSIYGGISWGFSYSSLNKFGLLTVKDMKAECEGLCLIEDQNYISHADQAVAKLLDSLRNELKANKQSKFEFDWQSKLGL